MFTVRLSALLLLLAVSVTLLPAAAPHTPWPIARWISELGSEDDATWRKAHDNLWRAGERAMPALKAAEKNPDPDVVLRARVLLAKMEWGIFPDTPAAVLAEIERYRDGDNVQKQTSVIQLMKQGRPGYVTVRFLLERETNAAVKKQLQALLKEIVRPVARAGIERGELEEVEKQLLSGAESNSADGLRDLLVFWVLTGKGEKMAGELAKRRADQGRAALLYRALGDRKAALSHAAGSGDDSLAFDLALEADDYKAALKRAVFDSKERDPLQERRKAALYARTGDRANLDVVIKGFDKPGERAFAYLVNGAPRQGVHAAWEGGLQGTACSLYVQQGRYREALALPPPGVSSSLDTAFLCLDQALLHSRLGDKEKRQKLVERAVGIAEKQTNRDHILGRLLSAGRRGDWFDEALADSGKVLDSTKQTRASSAVFADLSAEDGVAMLFWFDFLRKDRPNDSATTLLRLVTDWFVSAKADKDFDATVATARKYQGFAGSQKELWPAHIARACEKVGKPKLAEEVLKADADSANTVAAHSRYAGLLFDQKRWEEAIASYEKASKLDPTAAAPLYLRGVALLRLEKAKEGKSSIERARLLPLGEDRARYELGVELARRGLFDEAEAERLLLVRTAAFRSVLQGNAASWLGDRYAARKQYREAAWFYRRLLDHAAFEGGLFTREAAYLVVPSRIHMAELRANLAEGKLDEAMREAKVVWEYLPEESGIVVDLVRAFEKAGKQDEADRLFADRFARLQRASVEYPTLGDRHNRLAWLAARCGRRLDTALMYAKKSAELSPKFAAAYDTLAEVHFQRGEKADALKAIEEAVKLSPKVAYYTAQKKRIEAGDPKAEVPAR